MTLVDEPDAVTLEIRDEGGGFDPMARGPRGHFGGLGIEERADNLNAARVIESAPGTGTGIRVLVPGPAAARSNGCTA